MPGIESYGRNQAVRDARTVLLATASRRAIRREIFTSVKHLNATIRRFSTGRNRRKHPFVWTKPSEEILRHANRQSNSETGH